MNRWVALDNNLRVIGMGVTKNEFTHLCLRSLGVGGAILWVQSGQRYCAIPSWRGVEYGAHVDTFEHGPIRKSKANFMEGWVD